MDGDLRMVPCGWEFDRCILCMGIHGTSRILKGRRPGDGNSREEPCRCDVIHPIGQFDENSLRYSNSPASRELAHGWMEECPLLNW